MITEKRPLPTCTNCGHQTTHVRAKDTAGMVFLDRLQCARCGARKEVKQ